MRRVIISGTREALSEADSSALDECIYSHVQPGGQLDGTLVGVGDCPSGVDAFVRWKWISEALGDRVFRADWTARGKAAGPRRNAEMVAWAAEADEAA